MSTHGPVGTVNAQHSAAAPGEFRADGVCSAHPRLLTHYLIIALLTGPAFVALFPYLYFRYHTLRYRFDAHGVTMTVGILFRREIALTYRRIQDIHVNRGILQRWLGLATVACQTASGGSGTELVIEGMMDYEKVRDFLYQQMRGAKEGHSSSASESTPTSSTSDEALVILGEIRDRVANLTREVQSLRAATMERPHG